MTTELQAAMLTKIARHELNLFNGGEPETRHDAEIFADCIIETNQDKGVFTSLRNAGLVWHVGKFADAIVGMTDAGFAEYKSLASA